MTWPSGSPSQEAREFTGREAARRPPHCVPDRSVRLPAQWIADSAGVPAPADSSAEAGSIEALNVKLWGAIASEANQTHSNCPLAFAATAVVFGPPDFSLTTSPTV